MNVTGTKCCASREIFGLQTHGEDAKGAMLDFCKHLWPYVGTIYRTGGTYNQYSGRPYAFYTFSGVVKCGPTERNGNADVRNLNYGPKFAEFIKLNKLGNVVETPAKSNRANHPKHHVKLWIWCPNEAGLKRWYKANGPKNKTGG